MRFVIITNVRHIKKNDQFYGYAPYVHEMNIWLKNVNQLIVLAPLVKGKTSAIDICYEFAKIDFKEVPDFNLTSFKNILATIFKIPIILWKIFWAMEKADHIHLRCPGNIGLLGCIVQIFFPSKKKTAKYAGNWDPKSKQPLTYRMQKWILNNTFLTRNIQVLVYGEWGNQSKNIKSFFTATYSDSEKEGVIKSAVNIQASFIFVGGLSIGKNPMYAVKLIEKLIENKSNAILNLYGEGEERNVLEKYIQENNLENVIFLHGNQNKEAVKKAYQKSHFVILPSKSEGWPKAVAEGMFWGCVPIATNVSSIPFMLDYGNRGVLLRMDLNEDCQQIEAIIKDKLDFLIKSEKASSWSKKYTIDLFGKEIKKILIQ